MKEDKDGKFEFLVQEVERVLKLKHHFSRVTKNCNLHVT